MDSNRFEEDVFDHEVVDVTEADIILSPEGPPCPHCPNGVVESSDETQGNIGICSHCKTAVDLDAPIDDAPDDPDLSF